jgi:hypothetical protein
VPLWSFVLHLLLLKYTFNECTAAPSTNYEKVRAQNILENHRVFRSLGITSLSSLVKNAHATVEDEGPQKSGSEYEPQANEGYEEEEVSKVQFLLSTLQCLCNEYYLQLC